MTRKKPKNQKFEKRNKQQKKENKKEAVRLLFWRLLRDSNPRKEHTVRRNSVFSASVLHAGVVQAENSVGGSR